MGKDSRLNDPGRAENLRETIRQKAALTAWYTEVYDAYAECIARAADAGVILELGSGAGFAKDRIPDLVTSDILPYTGIDLVVDATSMPFGDGTLRFIGMLNVFHHIPDPAAFLAEAQRCLAPNGRILIVDQHRGRISAPILTHIHHEPFRPDAEDWHFDSTGPLSGANGALAWIVFQRDRSRFECQFPRLELVRYAPHTPLRYWLAGGLKPWSLIGERSFAAATAIDGLLTRISPSLGSFVNIEVCKR